MVPDNSLQYAPGRGQRHIPEGAILLAMHSNPATIDAPAFGQRHLPEGATIQAAAPKMPKMPKAPEIPGGDFGGFGGGDDDDSYYDGDELYGELGSGGPAQLGDVFNNMSLLLQRGFGPLVVIWFILSLVSCLCECPGWLIHTPVADEMGLGYDVVQYGPYLFNSVSGLLSLVVISTLAAMFLPFRTFMVAGPDAIAGISPIFKKILPKIPGALVIIFLGSLLSTVGLVLFIVPGLLIGALTTLAVYLFVTYELNLVDSFKEAARMAKSNLGIIAAAIIITIGISLFASAISFGCLKGITALGSYWASLMLGASMFITRFVTILAVILVWAATCITIETSDTNVYIPQEEDFVGY